MNDGNTDTKQDAASGAAAQDTLLDMAAKSEAARVMELYLFQIRSYKLKMAKRKAVWDECKRIDIAYPGDSFVDNN